jgi:hypothetical protein
MRKHHTQFGNFLRKGQMPPDAIRSQFMVWLRAILNDEQHRAALHTLLRQHELPVIQLGNTSKRKKGTAPRILHGVNGATF